LKIALYFYNFASIFKLSTYLTKQTMSAFNVPVAIGRKVLKLVSILKVKIGISELEKSADAVIDAINLI